MLTIFTILGYLYSYFVVKQLLFLSFLKFLVIAIIIDLIIVIYNKKNEEKITISSQLRIFEIVALPIIISLLLFNKYSRMSEIFPQYILFPYLMFRIYTISKDFTGSKIVGVIITPIVMYLVFPVWFNYDVLDKYYTDYFEKGNGSEVIYNSEDTKEIKDYLLTNNGYIYLPPKKIEKDIHISLSDLNYVFNGKSFGNDRFFPSINNKYIRVYISKDRVVSKKFGLWNFDYEVSYDCYLNIETQKPSFCKTRFVSSMYQKAKKDRRKLY